jgi:hypothetical protein
MGHLLGTPPACADAIPVSEAATDSILRTVVSEVHPEPHPGGVHAFAIDTPIPSDDLPGAGVEVNGWVIGQEAPLAGVRASNNAAESRPMPLDVRRPDVAADYPDFPYAAASGFSFWLPLPPSEIPWCATIEGVLPDNQLVPLAELRGDIVREQRVAAPGMRLVQAPDFAIIGTQRGGTTSLHAYLRAHPLVRTPSTKELHYITDRFVRGRDWYAGQFPAQLGPGELTGESTPYALFHPLAPQRLRAVAPNVKLIVLLRNPVERAYSHYLLERSRGDESLSFAEALAADAARLAGEEDRLLADPTYVSVTHKHASYLARGDYAPQLKRWFAHCMSGPRRHLLGCLPSWTCLQWRTCPLRSTTRPPDRSSKPTSATNSCSTSRRATSAWRGSSAGMRRGSSPNIT